MHFNLKLINFKFILFIIGFGLSIYNTTLVLHEFVTQPTVSRSIPQQNTELARPDVVVCKSIYAELLALRSIDHQQAQNLRALAVQTRNFAPFLHQNATTLLSIELSDSVLDELARTIHAIGEQFLNCSAMLGRCTTLLAGFSFYNSYDCCDSARQMASEDKVCYRISTRALQSSPGKNNAALFELRYGADSHDPKYTIHLVDQSEHIADVYQFPVTTIKASTEVDIGVLKQVAMRINYTDRCTTDARLALPMCNLLVINRLVNEECPCKVGTPMMMTSGYPPTMQHPSRRRCRPFEKWMCWSEIVQWSVDTHKKAKKLMKHLSKCYPRLCTEISFESKVSTELEPNLFDDYMEDRQPENEGAKRVKTSILYVYYSSLTVLYDHEARTQTWLTVVSSLGGVWGLWLGWSLYDAASQLLWFMLKISNKYKTVRNINKMDLKDKTVPSAN